MRVPLTQERELSALAHELLKDFTVSTAPSSEQFRQVGLTDHPINWHFSLVYGEDR